MVFFIKSSKCKRRQKSSFTEFVKEIFKKMSASFSNSWRRWNPCWKGNKPSLSFRQNLQRTQGKGWSGKYIEKSC